MNMNLGWAWLGVVLAAAVTFVVVIRWADTEEDRYIDDRGAVAAENAGRLGTGKELAAYPDEPFVVAHTTETAVGAAIAVAVVGSVVVLLATIAARLPERRT